MKLISIFITVILCGYSAVTQTGPNDPAEKTSDIPKKVAVDSGRAAVPMTLEGRKPVVEVKINGKGPFKFFLDTGAPGRRSWTRSSRTNCICQPTVR